MAECGIDKYDSLPARVGVIDVDYMRWRLRRCLKPLPWPIKWLGPPSGPKVEKEVRWSLEAAYEINRLQNEEPQV